MASQSPTKESALASLIQAGLKDVLHVPGQPLYDERVASYWSLTAKLKPWAIIQPRNTEEVSKAIKALVTTTDCKFAIRRYVHRGDWTSGLATTPAQFAF